MPAALAPERHGGVVACFASALDVAKLVKIYTPGFEGESPGPDFACPKNKQGLPGMRTDWDVL
jgi:hypothetical protein